jgi:hypothetical protein
MYDVRGSAGLVATGEHKTGLQGFVWVASVTDFATPAECAA